MYSKVAQALFAQALLVLALTARAAAAPEDEVVIEASAVRPALLTTTTANRVTFINRSGHLAHLEFTDTSGAHRVFQVPGQIWAVFQRPGRHTYVVHLGSGRDTVTLHGAVEVAETATTGPPTCAPETGYGPPGRGPCIVW